MYLKSQELSSKLRITSFCIVFTFLLLAPSRIFSQDTAFRPPAIPLVTNNPYFSIWSFSNHPGIDWPRHWTGSIQAMNCFAEIDGKNFRLLGNSGFGVPPMKLLHTEVLPTTTVYTFEEDRIKIELKFINLLLPDDLVLLSEPLTYISWKIEPLDKKIHHVRIYFDASAELVVNRSDQEVSWSRAKITGLDILRMGTSEQPVLKKSGDDLRIDWGQLYLVSPSLQQSQSVITSADIARKNFLDKGISAPNDDLDMPRKANDGWPVMAHTFTFDSISRPVERFLVLAYDDQYRIEFLKRKLLPYWKAQGLTTEQMLIDAVNNYSATREKCEKFDQELIKKLKESEGQSYCDLAVLAYRQSLAACSLAGDIDGTPLYFPKENFSNGCISTVDVIYPACPVLLYANPLLLKAQLQPLMIYAGSKLWKFPFAPHDLGTFPLANGQVYGGGEITEEDQMPVEESGNMLIMLYALAQKEHNTEFAKIYWSSIEKWGKYLEEKGLDPENQLCTDDFAGHLAHNANLSVKAIIALKCYSRLCAMTGRKEESEKFQKLAMDYAGKWQSMANDGDHYRLAFDKPGTWSQKYNLVWDKIFGFKLFEPQILKKEISFYKKVQNQYGLPLDNRKDYTKLDWTLWTATLADNSRDFTQLIEPVHRFLNETTDRVPMTDWYDTKTAKQIGFQARSVVGGVFIKMLEQDTGLK